MLYLIGGASRTGKTLMAKQLSSQMGIPYLSLDWIMMGFTNGIPEYGVHDKLFPDDIAKRLWPFYKAMFESMIAVDTTCIIEGEALLPGLLTQFVQEYPKELKVCFMGYVNVDLVKKVEEIRRYSNARNDWLADKSDDYLIDHIHNMMVHSQHIQQSCLEHRMQYFDTAENFPKTIASTIRYLLAQP